VANNVTLGRKQTFTHQQKQEAIKCVKAGKGTQAYSVSRWMISRFDR
jgi:hypothetical protein